MSNELSPLWAGMPPPPPAYVYLPTPSTAASHPMDMYGYSKCRMYVHADGVGDAPGIDIAVRGAPNESGPYFDELGPDAKRTKVASGATYVLRDVSRYVRIEVEGELAAASWTIWVVPMR